MKTLDHDIKTFINDHFDFIHVGDKESLRISQNRAIANNLDSIALNKSFCGLSLEKALSLLEYGALHPFAETITRYLSGNQNASDSHQLQRIAIEIRKLCIDLSIVRAFLKRESDNPRMCYMPSSPFAYIEDSLKKAGHELESIVFWSCITGNNSAPCKRLRSFLESDSVCIEAIENLKAIASRETMPAWGTRGT